MFLNAQCTYLVTFTCANNLEVHSVMESLSLLRLFLGWWLSMDPKDTFFKRLQPLEDFAKLFEKSERFGTWNDKTLGIVLVSKNILDVSTDSVRYCSQ